MGPFQRPWERPPGRRSGDWLMGCGATGWVDRSSRGGPAARPAAVGSAERAIPASSQIPWPAHRWQPPSGEVRGQPGCGRDAPDPSPARPARGPGVGEPPPGPRPSQPPPRPGGRWRCGWPAGSGAGVGGVPTPHRRARPAAEDRDQHHLEGGAPQAARHWRVALRMERRTPPQAASSWPRALSRSGFRWRKSSRRTSFTV